MPSHSKFNEIRDNLISGKTKKWYLTNQFIESYWLASERSIGFGASDDHHLIKLTMSTGANEKKDE